MSGNVNNTSPRRSRSTPTDAAVLPDSMDDDYSNVLSALTKLTRTVIENVPLSTDEARNEDWDYRRSFPEFQSSLSMIHDTLLAFLQRLIGSCTLSADVTSLMENDEDTIEDIADPILWEQCMDVYDVFIQQVEAYLLEQSKNTDNETPLAAAFPRVSKKNGDYYLQQQQRFIDLPKPQDIYSMKHHYKMNSQNYSRTIPFIPKLHPNPPFSTALPKHLVLLPGHGYDTRWGALQRSNPLKLLASEVNETLIAPSQHCKHCYQEEIDSFVYTAEQLRVNVSSANVIPINPCIEYQYIDSLPGLQELSTLFERNEISAVAVDLEAHSYRSFVGMVCLIQLSFRIKKNNVILNYIIDALKLHDHINTYLASILANPSVVKVFHGADMDIQWLQRDFGLYVVNLFDTGRAARVLKEYKQFHSIGYAHLVSHYCNGYVIDKMYQLADWRQRPIPDDMMQYAIQDTYYLIDIYEHLKHDLYVYSHETTDAIVDVLNTSRLVCSIRYCPEPFNPSGYRNLLLNTSSRHSHYYINPLQEAVLAALWDWRDQTARNEDESVLFVCTNSQLLRLAYRVNVSMDVSHIEAILDPPPPLIVKYASDLFNLIKNVIQNNQEPLNLSTNEAANSDDVPDDDLNDVGNEDGNEDDDEVVDSSIPAMSVNETLPVRTSVTVGPTAQRSFSAFFKPTPTMTKPSTMTKGDALVASTVSTETRASSRLTVTTSAPIGGSVTRSSPVLGTEALYEQAGWLTPVDTASRKVKVHKPSEGSGATDVGAMYVSTDVRAMTTTDDDMDDDIVDVDYDDGDTSIGKPTQHLSVNESNQCYRSNAYADESLHLKSGASLVSTEISDSLNDQNANRSTGASRNSAIENDNWKVKKDAIHVVLGLVSLKGRNIDDDDAEGNDDDPAGQRPSQSPKRGGSKDSMDMEAEFVIPRSIREIYMISNRNRRNKKAGSPTPERGVTPTNEKERLALEEADALLASRGAVAARYFFEDTVPGKRPKPSSQKLFEGRESEETLPYDLSVDVASKEDDFNFMKEIGWIAGRESTVDEFLHSGSLPAGGRSQVADSPVILSGDPSAFESLAQPQQMVGLINPISSEVWNSSTGSGGHNPFFSGAAAQGGGPLQQQRNLIGSKSGPIASASNTGSSSNKKSTVNNSRNNGSRQSERPERKESQTHAYRKR